MYFFGCEGKRLYQHQYAFSQIICIGRAEPGPYVSCASLLIFFLQICVIIIISCKIFWENHISAKIELLRSASSPCFARFHDFLGKQIQQCWKLGGSASLSLALGHLNMMIPFRVQRSWQKSRPGVSLKRFPFSLERNTEFSRELISNFGRLRVTLCLGILRGGVVEKVTLWILLD